MPVTGALPNDLALGVGPPLLGADRTAFRRLAPQLQEYVEHSVFGRELSNRRKRCAEPGHPGGQARYPATGSAHHHPNAVRSRPDLAEPLLFGPMLPSRYRLDGPGAHPDAAATFRRQLASSARSAVEPDDVASLTEFGFGDLFSGNQRR